LILQKEPLSIAYVSPGWPLSSYPNGIVTYIENIVAGFDGDVITHILTHKMGMGNSDTSVIDLSKFVEERGLVNKLIDKVLYRVKSEAMEKKLCQRRWAGASRRIITGMDKIGHELDLIEIEESFGLGKMLVEQTNVPVVTRLHGPWFIHGPIMQLEKNSDFEPRIEAEGIAIKSSHAITAPSQAVLDDVREHYNLPLPNAKVIPNPVHPVAEDFLWRHNPSSEPFILVVGRFDLHKGGDLAINAFNLLAQEYRDIKLVFVGPDRGVNIDGRKFSFAQYVDRYVTKQSVKDRISFLGHCNSDKIKELRQTAVVTMMTSRYETFSISLAEALSTGSPVVATNVGAIKELVTDGYNGLLAEACSAESIAEKVIELVNDPEKMKTLSKNAIKESKKRFSPSVVAKQTVQFYKSVLANV
jgi:glycosyltransferase involved in cell wall biosynthesis